MNIKKWYAKTYPTDGLVEAFKPEATFEGLFETLDHYGDVYNYIGVYDSVVRERCFSKLAEIMDCTYDYIYEQWVRGA